MTPTSTAAEILVVDDEPDLRTLYEITLQRCGYAVCSAGDLEQARDLLQRVGAETRDAGPLVAAPEGAVNRPSGATGSARRAAGRRPS